MAISRVPGFSLLPNLDRQGVDLQFTTDGNALVTMDFTQFRLGVNESSPSEVLTVNGNALISNGHVYTSANLAYDIGSLTNYWNNLYIGNISVINDLRVAGTFDIDGNLFTANITGNVINADAIYENGYQVLTTNTTITINGAATGSGDYSNVYITLENSGVVAGSYGDTEFVPQINVNDKGLTTSASNIVLSRIGNLRVADTTISAGDANLVLTANTGLVSLDNNSIIDLADPIDNQDAATKAYVDSQISSSGSRIISDDTEVAVHDDGINPGYVTVTVDGNLIANITETNTEFYNSVGTGIIGFDGNTITSTGNINLNLPGIIRVQGDGAMRIPTGDNATRPLNPETGFIRFNTDRDSIEYYDGVDWDIPGDFTVISDVLPTDGVSNAFSISANTTTAGVLVSINGTMQQPGNAYTVMGNVITFVETPLTTDVIEVRTIGAGGVTIEGISLLDSSVSVDGVNVNIKGNLVPTANLTYSIGSQAYQWKEAFISNITTVNSIGVNANDNDSAIINLGSDGVGNIGSLGNVFNTLHALASTAGNADLAEIYTSDADYPPGTVLVFGGDKEVTISEKEYDSKVAGIVSESPAYLMNSRTEGVAVALQGRVKVNAKGPISKGDLLTSSNDLGVAMALDHGKYVLGCALGKSLNDLADGELGTVEIVVGRL